MSRIPPFLGFVAAGISAVSLKASTPSALQHIVPEVNKSVDVFAQVDKQVKLPHIGQYVNDIFTCKKRQTTYGEWDFELSRQIQRMEDYAGLASRMEEQAQALAQHKNSKNESLVNDAVQKLTERHKGYKEKEHESAKKIVELQSKLFDLHLTSSQFCKVPPTKLID